MKVLFFRDSIELLVLLLLGALVALLAYPMLSDVGATPSSEKNEAAEYQPAA